MVINLQPLEIHKCYLAAVRQTVSSKAQPIFLFTYFK